MAGRILPLEQFVFTNFNLTHFQTLTPLLQSSTYTPVEDWEPLPPATYPPVYVEGQGTGNKYSIVKGLTADLPTQFYLGVQNFYTPQTLGDSDYWEIPLEQRPTGPSSGNREHPAFCPSYYLYVETELPYDLPNLRIHSTQQPPTLTPEAIDNHFLIQTPTGTEPPQPHQILPANLLPQLLQILPHLQIETSLNKLYITIPLPTPGRYDTHTIKFNKTWEQTIAEITAALQIIPDLANTLRPFAIHPEEYERIEHPYNHTQDPEAAKNHVRKTRFIAAAIAAPILAIIAGSFFIYLNQTTWVLP